jgi:hypothetical protein
VTNPLPDVERAQARPALSAPAIGCPRVEPFAVPGRFCTRGATLAAATTDLRAVMSTMRRDEAYAVIRQAGHDAVHAQLAAPPDSVAGSLGLRKVTDWLAAEYGEGAVRDLTEELAPL